MQVQVKIVANQDTFSQTVNSENEIHFFSPKRLQFENENTLCAGPNTKNILLYS